MTVVSRRSLLKTGACAPIALAIPAVATAGAGADAWILDTRFPGVANVDTGITRRWYVAGDVTRLWLDELDPRWRNRGFVVSGYTDETSLFLLERLAHDRGRRVTERDTIRDVVFGDRSLVRWTIAPVHRSVLP